MFDSLFVYAAVRRRHQNGPLAAERKEYLRKLAATGLARHTVLDRARYSLHVAAELQRWPADQRFGAREIDQLSAEWARKRCDGGHASVLRWTAERFRFVATEFLQEIGRFRPEPPLLPGRYQSEVSEFLNAQMQMRWTSPATARTAGWHINQFLRYLDKRELDLAAITSKEVDAFFEAMSQRWSRVSLRGSAKALRAWFRFGADRGWMRPGLADVILLPRIYRDEGVPLGPSWDVVGKMLKETTGGSTGAIRDHAILLLLSVYGLRSGEVRRLCLGDFDWASDRIRVVRSKSKREEHLPLELRVGNAVARYLVHGRPQTDSRIVFLTLRAPHRPLSAGGLYHVVSRLYANLAEGQPRSGRGPHGLRHACARHLLESGRSIKDVGDHLGHRSPDATRKYAKVNLKALRQVAFEDLGGLQ